MEKAMLVLVCLLAQTGSVYAACKSEACKRATAWKSGYTAVVLDDEISRADYFAALMAIQAQKGIIAIEADRVLLGWVPRSAVGNVKALRGVKAILFDAVAHPEELVRHENARDALEFFNSVITGRYEDAIEAGQDIQGSPLVGCVVGRPAALSSESTSPNVRDQAAGILADAVDTLGRFARADRSDTLIPMTNSRGGAGSDSASSPFRNPYMAGRITVQLFRFDSDGTLDPNLYTWTSMNFQAARDQVYGAFTVWVNEAAARNVPLSFMVNVTDPFSRYTRNFSPTPTRYEPITRSSSDDYLWINDALARHGYGASPLTAENVYAQNEAFNDAMAADPTYGPFDGSFSVYIVYNPPPAPGVFANGQRAYARYGGPFTMLTWTNDTWGPQNLGRVLEHETGHIFWACDEYYDAATNSGCFSCDTCMYNIGPRNKLTAPWITNANCDNPNVQACDFPKTTCIMQTVASGSLCQHTRDQIGW